MNADFRDGYASVPISNWPGQAGVGGDLLSRRRRSRPAEPHGDLRRDPRPALRSTVAAPPA